MILSISVSYYYVSLKSIAHFLTFAHRLLHLYYSIYFRACQVQFNFLCGHLRAIHYCYKYIITNFTAFVKYLFYFPGRYHFPFIQYSNLFLFCQSTFPSFAKYFFAFLYIYYNIFFYLCQGPFLYFLEHLQNSFLLYLYYNNLDILCQGPIFRFILSIGLLSFLYLYNSIFYGGCQGPILNTFLIVVYYSIL